MEDHPGPLAGHQQRRGQPPRIGLVVAVDPQAPAHAGREHRLQPSAFAPRQPYRFQPAPQLEGVEFAQVGAVVGVQRHGQRAAGAVADLQAARLLQLRHETRVAAGRCEVEAEQRLLAVVQFGDGGEHPGRDPARAAARLRIGERGAQPAPRGPPGGDQPHEAAADHQHIGVRRRIRRARWCGRWRHGRPAPPFAGMTRIRFVRSEAGQPPSQPGTPGSRECVSASP